MNKIGSNVEVTFVGTNKKINGKVDTGASICCLHATDINVSGSQVSFNCDALSQNTITLPIADTMVVKSADGGDNTRPVVKLTININGVSLNDVDFNLNDRTGMDSACLIGQNAIKQGEFVVDINETEDPIGLEPEIDEVDAPIVDKNQEIRDAIEVLVRHGILGPNFSCNFSDED